MVVGPDKALPQILKQRLHRSEGANDDHCFTKEPANLGTSHASCSKGACKEESAGQPGKLFSMDAGDTPPGSRCSSPSPPVIEGSHRVSTGCISHGHVDLKGPLKGGAEDEAESTDGLPDQHEAGDDADLQSDLHYDWQFDLMNSMPREKALELARVLKRSEQEKVRESEKLRQEVHGLKREMQERSSSSLTKCWWMSCAMALVSALLGVHFAGVASVPPAPLQEASWQVTETQQGSSSSARAAPQAPVTPSSSVTAPLEAPAMPLAAPAVAPAVPAAQHAQPQVPLWAAHVIPKSNKVELWHPALSQDLGAIGPVKADLGQAMTYFPKISKGWRFASVWVSRAQLNKQQAVISASLSLGNSGAITWPPETAMRLILGAGMGFTGLSLGQPVMPGANVDMTLQLEVPNLGHGDGSAFTRSVWVLEANGEPFGPLLVAEVNWAA
eukprot:TRINITY_DN14188_c0_g1_i2.p1 TRINITY_DN14188_c0_g1~~TRINITY_DN14188_c0_g1_i2.p1  ORF type:complete len:467 (+),score=75.74 TRINITY_DN14188_c0_g1_i2:74-1402(+)